MSDLDIRQELASIQAGFSWLRGLTLLQPTVTKSNWKAPRTRNSSSHGSRGISPTPL